MSTANNQKRGLSLPKALRDHIEREEATSGGQSSLWRKKGKSNPSSRRDARKQERLERKKRKADHFLTRTSSVKHDAEEDSVPLPKRRKTAHFAEHEQVDHSGSKGSLVSPRRANVQTGELSQPSEKPKEKKAKYQKSSLKVASKYQKHKIAPAVLKSREEEEDDACIAYYEAMLGYKEGRRKKSDGLDGLDDLLDFADSLIPGGTMAGSDVDGDPGGIHGSDSQAESASESGEDLENVYKDEEEDEWTSSGSDDLTDDGSHSTHQLDEVSPEEEPTTSAGRYVPPALRMQKDGTVQEDLTKLTRQLKGLLNRMSEQNMTTILDSVEELYRKHRRNDVTSTLTTLIIDGISSHAMLIDSFVVLHAAFICSMHRLIGMDFAAFVVQHVVASYEQHLAHAENAASHDSGPSEDLGKECSNLIILLAELYNFQVVACVLIYDLIRELLSRDLSELRVELLLKILRSSGQQLRQDDPSALKDIVTLAHSCIAKQGVNLNSRTRFMTETLTNLKGNKIKKAAGAQHQGGDAVERLKKFLSGLGKKRHVQIHEPLRVSLEDLRTAETKGKWWLVGAAWAGDPLTDRQQSGLMRSSEVTDSSENHSLLKLARKQGMNTDIRRSIFVVLMSSEDYMDACERLSQLNLTEVQQREIVRVCLHCCSNEKSYNPYYALICQRFCQLSHSHKITLQYWFWDFLRDLGETNVGGTEVIKNLKSDEGRLEVKDISFSRIRNVAKAYGWWIAKDICSLLILKPVDFTLLKPQSRKFLKELFAQIFAATQGSSPMLSDQLDIESRNRGVIEDTFNKATKIENLGLGLIFFFSHAFREETGFLQWASSVAKETLQSGMDQIPRV
ncbi:hypothetical protein EV401DRAFT_1288685 [Pisolithus croceorrhizus]|nr:hypothetical protein EV401DRAFT_1288685 [Pisolithus croceorrhizus]